MRGILLSPVISIIGLKYERMKADWIPVTLLLLQKNCLLHAHFYKLNFFFRCVCSGEIARKIKISFDLMDESMFIN